MIVFLDIDGTFAFEGLVPPPHVEAVRAARARGHHVLLCTGRPVPMLGPAILEAGFDGVVASAGAYVEVGGEVLRDERFPTGLAHRTVQVLDAHDTAYILESPHELLGPPGTRARAARVWAGRLGQDDLPRVGGLDFLDGIRERPGLAGTAFSKVTVLDSRVPIERLGQLVGPEVSTITSSIPGMGTSAGEVYLAHVHKALGAHVAADHLGLGRESAVAVGDGLNDLEVLRWAGVGVAIEGAPDPVLAAATMTAARPQDAGLVHLFAELGLTR